VRVRTFASIIWRITPLKDTKCPDGNLPMLFTHECLACFCLSFVFCVVVRAKCECPSCVCAAILLLNRRLKAWHHRGGWCNHLTRMLSTSSAADDSRWCRHYHHPGSTQMLLSGSAYNSCVNRFDLMM